MQTLNIKGLEEIFKKNLYDDYLHTALSKIISYEIEKTVKEVKDLETELVSYESKFNMQSEEFYKKYSTGELDDSSDFFEWAALYQMYQRSVERLTLLKSND